MRSKRIILKIKSNESCIQFFSLSVNWVVAMNFVYISFARLFFFLPIEWNSFEIISNSPIVAIYGRIRAIQNVYFRSFFWFLLFFKIFIQDLPLLCPANARNFHTFRLCPGVHTKKRYAENFSISPITVGLGVQWAKKKSTEFCFPDILLFSRNVFFKYKNSFVFCSHLLSFWIINILIYSNMFYAKCIFDKCKQFWQRCEHQSVCAFLFLFLSTNSPAMVFAVAVSIAQN